MSDKRICKKCVLAENPPVIFLNEEGICNVCLDEGKTGPMPGREGLLETDLVKTLDKYRGKGEYDCLVMCSGGKDSTAALYFMKARYKLNPLVLTFDNGFEDKKAVMNARKATNKLGVDLYYYKSWYMKEMFAEMVKRGTNFPACSVCSLWYMQVVYRTAAQYEIPLIVGGWTKGQVSTENEHAEMGYLCKDLPDFIAEMRKKYDKYKNFPRHMNDVKKRYRNSRKATLVSPHWFLPVTPEEYTEIIKKELEWEEQDFSYPAGSTNCLFNYLGSYLCKKDMGFTHFHIECSKLIRSGEMTREEAMKMLEINPEKDPGSSLVRDVLDRLGLNKEDICGGV